MAQVGFYMAQVCLCLAQVGKTPADLRRKSPICSLHWRRSVHFLQTCAKQTPNLRQKPANALRKVGVTQRFFPSFRMTVSCHSEAGLPAEESLSSHPPLMSQRSPGWISSLRGIRRMPEGISSALMAWSSSDGRRSMARLTKFCFRKERTGGPHGGQSPFMGIVNLENGL